MANPTNPTTPAGTPGAAPPIPATQPVTVPQGFPLPNAVENANAARGQILVDSFKNVGHVDTSPNPNPGPWRLKR